LEPEFDFSDSELYELEDGREVSYGSPEYKAEIYEYERDKLNGEDERLLEEM